MAYGIALGIERKRQEAELRRAKDVAEVADDNYFRALRRELQEALGEGVILVERQQVTLI